jgi:hypothetical protein
MNVLIDGDGHEFLTEDFDEGRILEYRRTVGDAVVSDTRERMPGPAEHVDGLVLLRGLCSSFEEGEMPGDGLPGFFGGREVFVEFGEVHGAILRDRYLRYQQKRSANSHAEIHWVTRE